MIDTRSLEKFATAARRTLIAQVTAQLDRVLRSEGALRATHADAIDQLKIEIDRHTRAGVIERVAYTWFNRFCALRMLDANHLQTPLVVSPAAGESQPQILQQALQGIVDPLLPVDTSALLNLLMGRTASANPQQDAYALLLVAACNAHHATMPFLFQPIDDYTELLIPTDLLSNNSVLAELRRTLTDDVCKDVEVIGWLYQFYIAEKKEEVDAKVKKGGKVEPDELPAKTSLYTPDWIVRYLVENSLGRLWMRNRPHSMLAQQMRYFIAPEPDQPAADFLKVNSPEELTVCDPACGSGHMLTYAFDLLYAIYREEGYSAADIPRLILQKNLYGLEIDPRSAALAAFALTMKACQRDARFLERKVKPNITLVEGVEIAEREIAESPLMREIRRDPGATKLFDALIPNLFQWEKASIVGSLLRPHLTLTQIDAVRQRMTGSGETLAHKIELVLEQAEPLARKYDVVVTNPPYITGGYDPDSKAFAEKEYPKSKSDYFAMFIERNLDLAKASGLVAMITMQSWMFLSSYEALRKQLLQKETIVSMAHVGARAFDTIGGEVVNTTAFVLEHAHHEEDKGVYLRLVEGRSEAEKQRDFMTHKGGEATPTLRFAAAAADFKLMPGEPIAYWASEATRNCFRAKSKFADHFFSDGLTKTGENERFVRLWWEITHNRASDPTRYRTLLKGGGFRSYFGYTDLIVNWSDEARQHFRRDRIARLTPEYLWQAAGITWTKIGSNGSTFRILKPGMIAESVGPAIFPKNGNTDPNLYRGLAFLSSVVGRHLLDSANPTIKSETSDVLSLPFQEEDSQDTIAVSRQAILLSKSDWDAYETSWDFTTPPLLDAAHRGSRLESTYNNLRRHWQQQTLEMQRLEEENNRIFIDAYGLQAELSADVPLHEITLTCNPHYRYGAGKSEEEYATLQRAETLREFVSYAVGCALGRYAIDKPGLILANQGETLADWQRIVGGAPRFTPDADNVLPILDGDWFPDDIVARIKAFLRVTFGDAHFVENLAYLEASLGKELRSYMVRDFYADHLKRYQKRPIYWLFSSEGGAFNALIYMHRYRSDTASIVLNTYLRPYQAKVEGQRKLQETIANDATLPQGQRTKAQREVDRLRRVLVELETYERDVLYPLATERIEIDLDDGVKVNYARFGKALKTIK